MDQADEDAIAQLGLPEGEYAEIATVPQGLPACKAGLQPKDIIVSIDGKTPASAGTIRDVMKTKNPGDKVAIEVVRKGNRVKTEVPLEAFDGKKFKAYNQTMSQSSPQWQAWSDKMSKEMQERSKGMSRALKDNEKYVIGVPRGQNGEPLILMDRMGADQKALEERLSTLESQLKRVEEMLKRLESRGEQNVTPSGGGGTPKPMYAIGL
jgi:membrane-associated protease RseP (regulator of RpoE activity)